jgi:hypothetical protein
MGHISNYWSDAQQAYYTSLALDNTGKQWVKQLILQRFNISWDMWEHRNGIKYNTVTPARLLATQRLDKKISEEYQTGDKSLLPRDRKWFPKSLEHTLTHYSSVQKAQWLASVDNARWRWTRRKDLLRAPQDASRQLL